jgi:hypothetical protein
VCRKTLREVFGMVKKILYGTGNFEKIIQENGYYVDKTRFIREIEELGASYLLFLRPRRFGKSLFISTLEHYYDINRKDQFEELFGGLDIGREPTPLRNSFPILKLNFSGIAGSGKIEDVERSFNLKHKLTALSLFTADTLNFQEGGSFE